MAKKFLILLSMLFLFGIILASNAGAYMVPQYHNQSFNSSATDTLERGVNFTSNTNYKIRNVTLAGGVSDTTIYLANASKGTKDVLASCTPNAALTCDLNYTLVETQKYVISSTKGASHLQNCSPSYFTYYGQLKQQYLNFTFGTYWNSGWNPFDYWCQIYKIYIEVPDPPMTEFPSTFLYLNNGYSNTGLTSFNATIDGTTYGTSGAALNTTLLMNDSALHNITFLKTGYLAASLANVNLSANYTGIIYQSQLNLTGYDLISSAAVSNFTTVAGLATNVTTSGKAVLYLDAGTYAINATSAGQYCGGNLTVTTTANTSTATNINLYRCLYVYALNNVNGATIQNFTATILGITNPRTIINTTTGGKSFFIVTNEIVNITITATGYAPISYQTTITALDITNLTSGLYTTNSFNLTFKNEATLALLNGTTVYLDLISPVYANNYSTNNGSLYIDLLTPTTYTFRYYGSGFVPRLSSFTLTNNTYNQITLLLLAGAQNVTMFVYDETNNPVEAATIKVYRYSTASNSYILVNTIDTDFEGKAISNLQTNAEFYRFYIYYGGDLKLATTPAYVSGDQLLFSITTGEKLLENYFKTINEYTYSLTYLPSSANFRFYYDTNGEGSSGCINLYTIDAIGQKVYLSQSCQAAATSTILLTSPNVTDVTYYAEAVITVNGNDQTVGALLWGEKSNGITGDFGLFIGLIIVSVFAMAGLADLRAGFVFAPLGLLLSVYLGFIKIPIGSAFAVLVVGIILALVMSRSD